MHVLQLRKNTPILREELQVGENHKCFAKNNCYIESYVILSLNPNMTLTFTKSARVTRNLVRAEFSVPAKSECRV